VFGVYDLVVSSLGFRVKALRAEMRPQSLEADLAQDIISINGLSRLFTHNLQVAANRSQMCAIFVAKLY
jgi:uncharacterized membrane protein YqhA